MENILCGVMVWHVKRFNFTLHVTWNMAPTFYIMLPFHPFNTRLMEKQYFIVCKRILCSSFQRLLLHVNVYVNFLRVHIISHTLYYYNNVNIQRLQFTYRLRSMLWNDSSSVPCWLDIRIDPRLWPARIWPVEYSMQLVK